MASPLDHVAEIAAWLAATDIDQLELTGPDGHLSLNRGNAAAPFSGPASHDDGEAGGAAGSANIVVSPSFGIFLHSHPLHETALVRPGDPVAGAQVVGLLKLGALLVPVRAPRKAVVDALLAADGSLVGFGDPLLALSPQD
jgi:acetyl-CoA carboxylase biotin carboxyl carrier protein